MERGYPYISFDTLWYEISPLFWSQVWVDWETPVGDWETQEGQCCIHTPVQWRREGKKRRKELAWWQSRNLSAVRERKEKKF